MRYCRFELVPILGTVNRERCQVTGRSGLRSDPSQGERAFAVIPQHGAVAGEFQVDLRRCGSLYEEHFSP